MSESSADYASCDSASVSGESESCFASVESVDRGNEAGPVSKTVVALLAAHVVVLAPLIAVLIFFPTVARLSWMSRVGILVILLFASAVAQAPLAIAARLCVCSRGRKQQRAMVRVSTRTM